MDEKTIKKGTIINALGIAGKAMLPVLFILITRFFGPKIMGIYFLAFVIMDMTFNISLSSLKDGMALFAAKHHHPDDPEEEAEIYRSLANAVAITLGVSVVAIIFYLFAGKAIALDRYPDGQLASILTVMVWALPLYAVPVIVSAAIRGLLIMKWEAILIGFLRPALFCISTVIVYAAGRGIQELAVGYLIANAVLFLLAGVIFLRHFSFTKLCHAFKRPFWNTSLLKFLIPQNLNTTFNTLITNLDVIMLGFFKTNPEIIGYYGMGAQIVRNIRQIKVSFAGILGPIATKLHRDKNSMEIERLFNKTVHWTMRIALPALFLVGIFRSELLHLFHKSFSGDAYFMLILLIPPFFSCLIGMAGDIVVMTGHAAWNLFNSVSVAVLNFFLNMLLIPGHGIMGAAVATAISATVVYLMQLLEIRLLIRVHFRPAVAMRSFLYIVPPLALFLLLRAVLFSGTSLPDRMAQSIPPVVLYAAIMIYDRRRLRKLQAE